MGQPKSPGENKRNCPRIEVDKRWAALEPTSKTLGGEKKGRLFTGELFGICYVQHHSFTLLLTLLKGYWVKKILGRHQRGWGDQIQAALLYPWKSGGEKKQLVNSSQDNSIQGIPLRKISYYQFNRLTAWSKLLERGGQLHWPWPTCRSWAHGSVSAKDHERCRLLFLKSTNT